MPFYQCLAKDIKAQKARLGGHFIVARAIPTRKMMDAIKEVLPDCIFILLTMSKESQKKTHH